MDYLQIPQHSHQIPLPQHYEVIPQDSPSDETQPICESESALQCVAVRM